MSIIDKAAELFSGEPARVIGYGGAAILYIVAKASGTIDDVTPEEALAQAGVFVAAVAGVIESIRHFVTPVSKVV